MKQKLSLFTILVIIMAIISLLCINSASHLLNNNILFKQILWYIIGFSITYIITRINNDKIYKNIWYLYWANIILLILLLLFATPINNSKCWFNFGFITFQPSEFMKIVLILVLGITIDKFNNNYKKHTIKDEFIFLIKIAIIVLIPSILTFLEPDTGVVLIYIIITITMLFISGIKYRWFLICFMSIFLFVISILIIYKFYNEAFINIFGTSFLMRIDRLLDWSSKNGYQLNNSLSAIGGAGLLGFGFNNTPIYFPEADTDFIFTILSSNIGFIGSFVFIILLTYFDILLIKLAIKTKKRLNKYIISGIIGMLLYSQFQNIGMTFGLIPITGITLPFISYGGSSLISYMIILGIILNIEKNS